MVTEKQSVACVDNDLDSSVLSAVWEDYLCRLEAYWLRLAYVCQNQLRWRIRR